MAIGTQPAPMPDVSNIEDPEERELTLAVHFKTESIRALARAAHVRKLNGRSNFGIIESLDLEDTMRAGYQRALENRKRELSFVGKKRVK